MATRDKGNASAAKEKRGTSPSYPLQTERRKTATHLSRISSLDSKRDGSPSSEKNKPNYLRATASSGKVDNPPGKKPASSTSSTNSIGQRATLTRRSSLDKPNSASPVSRSARSSPTPKEGNPRSSSTLSAKVSSTTSHKPVADRTSVKSISKDAGKSRSLYARPVSTVKKSSIGSTKKSIDAESKGLSAKVPAETVSSSVTIEALDIAGIPEVETLDEDQHVNPNAVEAESEDGGIKDDDHNPGEIPVQEELENLEIPSAEEKHEVDQEDMKVDKEITVSDDQAGLGYEKVEAPEEKVLIDEIHVSEQQQVHEIISTSASEETQALSDEIVKTGEEKAVGESEEKDQAEAKKEEDGSEETKARNSETEGGAKEDLVQQTTAPPAAAAPPPATTTAITAVKQKPQVIQGKKESVVSNNVIEETASKLREQRKNKVRALAGAFETVISLQEPRS